jgi:hypothetical protein
VTDLIVVSQTAHWQRLKLLVLDSVSSPITRRVYNLGLNEFFEWYGSEPRPGFTKATVSAWEYNRVVVHPACPAYNILAMLAYCTAAGTDAVGAVHTTPATRYAGRQY